MKDERKLRNRVHWFAKHVGKAINRYDMIHDGDHILAAVSGGKDSLALCVGLVERKKWVPIDYRISALQIEWEEYPLDREQKESIAFFFAELGMEYRLVTRKMIHPSYADDFNCYICSRNRKRILFEQAKVLGIKKIALGHHLDDVVETTLMNLFFKGEIATMMPVQDFFDGEISIIRPMSEVYEREIARVAREMKLPVVTSCCPRLETSKRGMIKEMVKQLSRVNRKVRENIYRAPGRINHDYIP